MFLSTQSESNQMGCTLSLYFNPVLVHQHFLNPVHRISTQLLGHSLHQRIFLDDTIHAWRIAVFYKADLDLQLQLIADVLIVQPVSKRRFGVDNLFDLLRQSLALVVDDSTPSTSLSVPYSKSYWSRRARRIKIKKGNFLFNYSHYYLI